MNLNYILINKMDLASNLLSWLTRDNKISPNISNLGNHQIITLATSINNILKDVSLENISDIENKNIKFPSLVVVGTQSAGKSSVLNGIASKKIFPTGDDFVTQGPTEAQLIKINNIKDSRAEFGNYNNNGEWIVEKVISMPDEKDNTLPQSVHVDFNNNVQNYIKSKTKEITNNTLNITDIPIYVRIYSCYVSDLSFVDLPGLTLISRDGQPADIKEQIEKLSEKYISKENTIVLLVMQARVDLETDVGMAFIKKNQHKNSNVIGLLTKPDLMNKTSHVGDQLLNKVSKNLTLKYGYFLVKNKVSSAEIKSDVLLSDSDKDEKTYFGSHDEYKKPQYKDHVGYEALIGATGNILITAIKDALPQILLDLSKLELHVIEKLSVLGSGIPTTNEGKLSEIYRYVNKFSDRLIECIESRGTNPNIGKSLKICYNDYVKEVNAINPFRNNTIYNDTYFENIVSTFEGYHLSGGTSIVTSIEKCITDVQHKPLLLLKNPSHKCVKEIINILLNGFEVVSREDSFTMYPLITSKIRDIITENLLSPYSIEVEKIIDKMLKWEGDFIWTSDEEFLEFLEKGTGNESHMINTPKCEVMYRTDNKDSNIFTGMLSDVKSTLSNPKNSSDTKIKSIKDMLEIYFTLVKTNFKDNIPKMIMSLIVFELQRNLREHLYTRFTNGFNTGSNNNLKGYPDISLNNTTKPFESIDSLFKEDPIIESKRKEYLGLKEKIESVKKIMQTI
jgi:GTP-binding protein EngB required for normal cell division